jgi:hypothetical protein
MKVILCFLILTFSLSCFGQTGSEIILFELKVKKGKIILSSPENISHHKGYDNQPSFNPTQPIIYYSSFDDSGRSDIKYYNYKTKQTANLTTTGDREYSPTVTPDGKSISCIIQRDNGVQDLGKYPINGGNATVLINSLKIGYHAWIDNERLLLFVLGDSNTNSLHYYNLSTQKDTILSNNIGRSLHFIPGEKAMSFIQKISEKESVIKRFDLKTGMISVIAPTLNGQDHITWLKNNILLTGNGTKLYSFQPGIDKEWQMVIIEGDISIVKGITRLSANGNNSKLAVVVSE